MAESDAKQALLERRRALQDKAERDVPGVESLDGLPNLMTRRVFRLPIIKTPADLKAIILGALAGILVFFVLIGTLDRQFWPAYVLLGLLAAVRVNSDFTQGDGIELKAVKPQRKASQVIGDVVWSGPHTPLENRLRVVHRGEEVPFEEWYDQEVESRSKAPRAGGA
jgi:hypothetical protein